MAKQNPPRVSLGDDQPDGEGLTIEVSTPSTKDGAMGRRVVSKPQQCPLCYEGQNNGVGKVYATRGNKQYRKCDRCGHTFVTPTKGAGAADVRHAEVDLSER